MRIAVFALFSFAVLGAQQPNDPLASLTCAVNGGPSATTAVVEPNDVVALTVAGAPWARFALAFSQGLPHLPGWTTPIGLVNVDLYGYSVLYDGLTHPFALTLGPAGALSWILPGSAFRPFCAGVTFQAVVLTTGPGPVSVGLTAPVAIAASGVGGGPTQGDAFELPDGSPPDASRWVVDLGDANFDQKSATTQGGRLRQYTHRVGLGEEQVGVGVYGTQDFAHFDVSATYGGSAGPGFSYGFIGVWDAAYLPPSAHNGPPGSRAFRAGFSISGTFVHAVWDLNGLGGVAVNVAPLVAGDRFRVVGSLGGSLSFVRNDEVVHYVPTWNPSGEAGAPISGAFRVALYSFAGSTLGEDRTTWFDDVSAGEGCLLWSDAFADGETNYAPVWTTVSGAPYFSAATQALSYAGPQGAVGVLERGSAQAFGTWKFRTKVEGDGHYAQRDVMFVGSDAQNGYVLHLGEPWGGSPTFADWRLVRMVNGAETDLDAWTPPAGFDLGVWRSVVVSRDVSGRVAVYVDGGTTPVLEAFDATYVSSSLFRVQCQDALGVGRVKWFDDFLCAGF